MIDASVFKRVIKRTVNRFGYEIRRKAFSSSTSAYAEVRPYATYSPWNTDAAFRSAYKAVQSSTLVDVYRCYELWSLVEQSAKLDGGLIEVGVWRGGTGALIAASAKACGITDPVYLCDTFFGVVKAGPEDRSYEGGEHAETSRRIVEKLVYRRLKLDNVRILQGVFPEETAALIEKPKFRFCHIDVDVYQSARDIVEFVWDKLVLGGIVVYDDYGFGGCEGVTKFVEEQRSMRDRVIVHNLNGHAVVIRTKVG